MSLLTRFQGPSRLVALVWLGALALACGPTHSPEEGPELARHAFESRAPQYRAGAVLATGISHSCAVLADGTVRCWGSNSDGQLGADTTSTTPVSPSGLSSVISVAAGGDHTCALRSDGTVRCWGENNYGQLGDGTTEPTHTPVAVDSVTNAVAIALGRYHSCALIADGTVHCWGGNSDGQLGDGTTDSRSTAAPVSALSNAIALSANSNQTCALISGGTLRCWGKNSIGQLGDGTTATPRTTPVSVGGLGYVTAIAVGSSHACALLEDGTLRCWGGNSYGQLGDGTTSTYTLTPVTVSGLSDVVNFTAGDMRTCALLGDGTARCWGYVPPGGSLGGGTTGSSSTPVTISFPSSAVAISTGWAHTCAILASGSVNCWGQGLSGQLGNGGSIGTMPYPMTVSGISNAQGGARLATGGYHTCAARPDGTVACWGHNLYGQLGDGSVLHRTSPVTVSGLSNVVALTAGYWHTCALLGDGTAKCWGGGNHGALGNGSFGASPTPVPVSGLSNAVALSGGGYHTCALRGDGTVMCWGKNTNGECGNGTPATSQTSPVQVTGIPDSGGARAIAIAAGIDHTCALLTDGKVRCWGANTSGQLGDGTLDPHTTPEEVSLLVRAVAITASQKHTCAVTASGTAYCWGDDSRGQVGDGAGSSGSVTRPVVVSGLSGAVTITSGYQHTCATTAAGGARCWGYNYNGQLGDMTNDDRYVPATVQTSTALPGLPVLPLSSAVTIDAGQNHTCAMRSNGTVRCWGYNPYGQLGDGTNDSSNTPVTVSGFP